MKTFMEKQKGTDYEARLEELLKDKERIYEAIKNSPHLKRKNTEAARQLSQLKPPFPWEETKQK